MTMKKNGVYEGEVIGLGTEGEGIIKCEGTTVFVPFCLMGEKVRFTVLKVKGNIAYGKVESVLTPSYMRVKPRCTVFGKCGGCDLQHMSYEAQLAFKRDSVAAALRKIGGIEAEVDKTVACAEEYRYRNKLSLPLSEGADGELITGFYAAHSHRIVPIDDCPIQSEWIKDAVAAIKKYAKTQHIAGYNEDTQTGVLRKLVVREVGGKFIFAVVAAKHVDLAAFADELEKKFKDFTLLLNVNPSQGNAVFGKEWHICRGKGVFAAEECGIKYSVGANTFVQVNDDVRAKLYARVLEEAESGATAVDLYSGGGLLTAMLAKKCGRAYGVEIVEEASRCADILKVDNGLEGRMFNICGAAEDCVERLFKDVGDGKKIIVCDPPRKGMERSVVGVITRSGADKVVLISCNPATLARDLGFLTGTLTEENGALVKSGVQSGAYAIKSVTPFDMFPQTKHVETLVVLNRV